MSRAKLQSFSARAVEPSAGLIRARYPILGTKDTNLVSPLPLGIGIRVLEEGKAPRWLPMYFASERVATSREIPSGWYVAGEIGKRFDLVISNVHRKGSMHFRGRRILSENVIAHGDVFICGENVCGRFFSPEPGAYQICRGFVVQRTEDLTTERPFQFSAARVGEDETAQATEEMGCIELKISLGYIDDELEGVEPECDNVRELNTAEAVTEKSAIKLGLSVLVSADRAAEKLHSTEVPRPGVCNRATLMGTVKIHIRQKSWLQSKNIIDTDGSAWRPLKTEHKKHSHNALEHKKRKREEVEIASPKKAKKEETIVIE